MVLLITKLNIIPPNITASTSTVQENKAWFTLDARKNAMLTQKYNWANSALIAVHWSRLPTQLMKCTAFCIKCKPGFNCNSVNGDFYNAHDKWLHTNHQHKIHQLQFLEKRSIYNPYQHFPLYGMYKLGVSLVGVSWVGACHYLGKSGPISTCLPLFWNLFIDSLSTLSKHWAVLSFSPVSLIRRILFVWMSKTST